MDSRIPIITDTREQEAYVLPAEDTDIEDQFTTHTYTLRDGKIVYSKGNDHIIDAIRCALLTGHTATVIDTPHTTVNQATSRK